MADGTVEERVIKVFADFKKISPDEIKRESTFEELGLDSLDGLNLIFELEEEFDLTVPDDKVQDMKSVGEVIEGIEYLIENPYDASAAAAEMMEKEIAARKAAAEAKKEGALASETAETPETSDVPETVEMPKAPKKAASSKPAATPKAAKPASPAKKSPAKPKTPKE
jgi:acyl carrier protein